MSIFESITGVAELRAMIAKQQRRIDDLELAVQGLRRPLVAAQVLAEAIVEETGKVAATTEALSFYESAGGFFWFKRATSKERHRVCSIWYRDMTVPKPWVLTFGSKGKGTTKSKAFPTRGEAEQFAFDVLQIHDGECTRRNKSTDWWKRVTIFEQLSVTNRGRA